MLVPADRLAGVVFGGALVLLMVLGAIGARLGGAPQIRAALRVAFWGVVAMGATALIGRAVRGQRFTVSAGAASASIRMARSGDETRLSLVGRATFLESYANLLPAEDILAHTEQNHAPGVYAAWLADPRLGCWLVEANRARLRWVTWYSARRTCRWPTLHPMTLRSSAFTC